MTNQKSTGVENNAENNITSSTTVVTEGQSTSPNIINKNGIQETKINF